MRISDKKVSLKKEMSVLGIVSTVLISIFLINQMLSLVYFWLNRQIDGLYLAVLGLFILGVLLWIFKSNVKMILIRKSDVFSMFLVLIMGLSFVSVLWNYNHSFRFPIITTGVDVMAHFNMFIKMVETGKLNYGSGVFDNFKPWSGWSEYPSGFYSNAGVVYLTLVKPWLSSVYDPVIITSFFSLFAIAIFCWFGYWLSVLVVSMVGNKNRLGIVHWLLLFVVVFYFFENTFYNLFDYGFMAQLTGLIILMVMTLAVLKKQETDNLFVYWLKLLVLNFGIANSWYFLTPLSGLVLLRECVKNKLYVKWWFYVTGAIVGGLSIYPVWMSLRNFDVVKEINAGGGVVGVKGAEILLMVLICLILKSGKRVVSKKLADISFFLAASAVYPIILGVYGLISKGSVAYYYNKSLYTVVIYLLTLMVYLVFKRINQGEMLVKNNIYLILLAGVILGVSVFTKIGERNSLFGERKVFMDREVYNAMMVAKESGLDSQYYFVPFGRFIDLISFYTYFGYLPEFYSKRYPNVDFKQYPWIFEEVKAINSDKPIMIFDAFTVKSTFGDDQKKYLIDAKIKSYPEEVNIRN